MHEVVLIAVKNAVSAATRTFTANSITRCFFMFHTDNCFVSQKSQKSQKF